MTACATRMSVMGKSHLWFRSEWRLEHISGFELKHFDSICDLIWKFCDCVWTVVNFWQFTYLLTGPNTSHDCVYHSHAMHCWVAITDCDWQLSTNLCVILTTTNKCVEYRCVYDYDISIKYLIWDLRFVCKDLRKNVDLGIEINIFLERFDI